LPAQAGIHAFFAHSKGVDGRDQPRQRSSSRAMPGYVRYASTASEAKSRTRARMSTTPQLPTLHEVYGIARIRRYGALPIRYARLMPSELSSIVAAREGRIRSAERALPT
jgi:hypothetical protein